MTQEQFEELPEGTKISALGCDCYTIASPPLGRKRERACLDANDEVWLLDYTFGEGLWSEIEAIRAVETAKIKKVERVKQVLLRLLAPYNIPGLFTYSNLDDVFVGVRAEGFDRLLELEAAAPKTEHL